MRRGFTRFPGSAFAFPLANGTLCNGRHPTDRPAMVDITSRQSGLTQNGPWLPA